MCRFSPESPALAGEGGRAKRGRMRGNRAERDGSVELRSLLRYTPAERRGKRYVSHDHSHLAPLDSPHPALRATFPRKRGEGVPAPRDLAFKRFPTICYGEGPGLVHASIAAK